MYGYLRVDGAHGRSALSPHQCGLCNGLGGRYRTRARWLAGHDPSLLLMLLDAINAAPAPRVQVRCPLPLVSKRCAVDPEWGAVPAVAALQLFLAGEKLFDDRVDRDGLTSRVAERLLRKDIASADAELASRGFPVAAVRTVLRRQPQLEADPRADIDACASPTAIAMATAVGWCAAQAGVADTRPAARFGACLGRTLYLVDALDDLPRDTRSGAFNPVLRTVGATLTPASVAFLSGALTGRVHALSAAFDALAPARHADVLRGALVDGLARRGEQALSKLPAPPIALALLPAATREARP